MDARFNSAGFELKFLGTMNGFSTSHTNAFFFPEKDVLAFVDLSMLNFEKARKLITPNLKRVILFLTHLHDDHASGVLWLAFYVQSMLPGVTLEVVTTYLALEGVNRVFDETGGRAIQERDKYSEVVRVFGETFGGTIMTRLHPGTVFTSDQKFVGRERQFERPDWFIRTVPTVHHPRISAATGFVFLLNGKAVIYSGDTNTPDPFYGRAEFYAEELSDRASIPTELYLEMETNKWPVHLCWDDEKKKLFNLMKRLPKLRVTLMHYNDRGYLDTEIQAFNERLGERRLYLAEEV